MKTEEIETELRRRIFNSLMGMKYGVPAQRIMKTVLTQAFVDGLIIESPGGLSLINPDPIILCGQIQEMKIIASFNNK
jgi:hypothetical protein